MTGELRLSERWHGLAHSVKLAAKKAGAILHHAPRARTHFEEFVAAAPRSLVVVDKVLELLRQCRFDGLIGERESSPLTLAAALGVLLG